MTGAEIIDGIRTDIQDTNEDRYTDAKLLEKLNEIYADFMTYCESSTQQLNHPVYTGQAYYNIDDYSSSAYRNDVIFTKQFVLSTSGQLEQIYSKNQRDMDYERQGWVFETGKPKYVIRDNFSTIRLVPTPSAEGTLWITFSRLEVPLTSSDTPLIPAVYHDAMVDGVDALCFAEMRDYANMNVHWGYYIERRQRCKQQMSAKTPDRFLSQRPVDFYNFPMFDSSMKRR